MRKLLLGMTLAATVVLLGAVFAVGCVRVSSGTTRNVTQPVMVGPIKQIGGWRGDEVSEAVVKQRFAGEMANAHVVGSSKTVDSPNALDAAVLAESEKCGSCDIAVTSIEVGAFVSESVVPYITCWSAIEGIVYDDPQLDSRSQGEGRDAE